MDVLTKGRRYYLKNRERCCAAAKGRYLSNHERRKEQMREAVARLREQLGEAGKKQRQEEARKAAEKAGRQYRTAEEWKTYNAVRVAEREKRKAEKERVRAEQGSRETYQDKWIRRLKEEKPEFYDAGLLPPTLVFRARYHLDEEFRARQIERAAKRDSRTELFDDGSLTPSVVRSLFSRKACPYCGKKMSATDKTLDHITPRWLGGWHTARNTIVCCFSCNSRKRNKPPERWLTELSEGRREIVAMEWRRINGPAIEQGWLHS